MSVAATVNTTTQQVAVTVNPTTREVAVTVSNARGAAGSNNVTSATDSDGTADLDLLNIETVTATVSGTLTANHIHGNLAGNVYAHVRAGETLTKGNPVYVSGSHGSGSTLIPIVSKAAANNAAKMPAIGIMDADLANNATGHMVIVGTITELNTAGLTVNAELYVASAGGLTATPPTARAQPVARVERVNANNGAIIVKVNGLSASEATASTLVRRTVNGDASFNFVIANTVYATDVAADYVVADIYVKTDDLTVDNAVSFNATTYTYGAGAASAHRIALGAGTTGAALFGAADAAAARTTLELGAFSTNGSITGTGALTFTSAAASNINLTPGTTGFVDITKASATSVRESILRAKVSDAGDDAFHVFNATSVDSRFTPGFSGSAFSAASQRALQFVAQTTSANDSGATPLMSFEARRTTSTTDPNNGTLSDIVTRPLFEWRNVTGSLATMAPSGALSLLATTASTSTTTGALVVSGGVGIAGNINAGGSIAVTGTVRTGGYTFATLPTPTQGMRTFITDGAALPVYMANAAGGSNVVTPVFYNGTNWINA